ncbi:MAG TPA: T9SS type A sorting domain-containing protein [Chryseolinea sp.]|nr:T9SS type A sorting domain-containing protein [Chryseolinea sp.]
MLKKIPKRLKLSAVLLLGVGLRLQAQNTIPASGGNALGSGGTASYSIGQMVYTTNTSVSNGSVTQGVQQPYGISVVTELEEAKGINLTVSTYPNPTTDYLTLSIDNFEASKLSYQLLDINGRLLETKKIDGNQTIIVTSNLMPAMYFLKVTESNGKVKTFKIIKN